MNPGNQDDFSRLIEAVEHSRRQLSGRRERRVEAIKKYVGAHYGSPGDDQPLPAPINLLELAVTVYTQLLVGGEPRVFATTRHKEYRPAAYELKLVLERMARRIHLQQTLWEVVQDALFDLGIVKIGLADDDDSARGWWSRAWGLYVDQVDLDDWVHDTTAKRLRSVRFAGNYYRVPLEAARENPSFDKEERGRLVSVRKQGGGEELSEEVGFGGGMFREDEVEEYTELLDLWLPEERLMVTCAAEKPTRPLRIVEWDGPYCGPYIYLHFCPVPGNAMPLTLVHVLRDLHDVAARLSRKLCAQALRQKSVLPISEMVSEEDAARVVEVQDGKAFRFGGGQVPAEVRFGGPDNLTIGFLMQLREWANRHGGNLDTLGGLAAQAGTLGQEQILAEQSSQRIRFMRQRTIEFVENIFRSMAHYLFIDPFVDVPYEKEFGGVSFEKRWNAETRIGTFEDYEISLEPYSMTYRSPEGQLQKLMGVLNTVVMPALPLLAQQGASIDFQTLLRLIEEYSGLDELSSIVQWQTGTPREGPGGVSGVGAMRATPMVRRYERRTIPAQGGGSETDAILRMMHSRDVERAV